MDVGRSRSQPSKRAEEGYFTGTVRVDAPFAEMIGGPTITWMVNATDDQYPREDA
jgi:hypothetical protein